MSSFQTYVAKNGIATLSTQNPNRDGTGAIATVITGSSDGTFVKTITITAVNNTSQGCIRLFINNGAGTIMLFDEITIPATTATSVEPAFEVSVYGGFSLKSGYSLEASTEKADLFAVSADCLECTNCACD